ncbi:MAG: hypothetical protein AAB328_08240, partial [candidate division NC10 bacterium]
IAARIHAQKRPLDLPALALRVKELPVFFLMVGGGPLEAEVDAAIAAATAGGARIRRLPFRTDIPELILAADRSYMLDGSLAGDDRPPAALRLGEVNFGAYPMGNGLTRLGSRFLGEAGRVEELRGLIGKALEAAAAAEAGLVTFTPDEIDWEDEVRIGLEARAAFSPDALTGMEASLRFAGPETLETKIFARLSAWQNWIFQRPNAVGPKGALHVYGTGQRSEFDRRRV